MRAVTPLPHRSYTSPAVAIFSSTNYEREHLLEHCAEVRMCLQSLASITSALSVLASLSQHHQRAVCGFCGDIPLWHAGGSETCRDTAHPCCVIPRCISAEYVKWLRRTRKRKRTACTCSGARRGTYCGTAFWKGTDRPRPAYSEQTMFPMQGLADREFHREYSIRWRHGT